MNEHPQTDYYQEPTCENRESSDYTVEAKTIYRQILRSRSNWYKFIYDFEFLGKNKKIDFDRPNSIRILIFIDIKFSKTHELEANVTFFS